MNRTLALVALCVSMVLGAGARADWPRFRGPNGGGVAADSPAIPTAWTAEQVLWKATLPGSGHSSPVIWENRLYVSSAEPAKGKRHFLCLDRDKGTVLWAKEFEFARFPQHQDNSYASASAAVSADGVFVCWTSPLRYELLGFEHDGKEKWKVNLGPFMAQHSISGSPVVVDGAVILADDQDGPDASVIAVDAKTGQQKWRVKRGTSKRKACCSLPCVYTPAAGPKQVILVSCDEGIASLDVTSGKTLWQIKNAFPMRIVASPIVGGGMVFGQCGEGQRNRLTVAAKIPAAGEEAKVAWTSNAREMPYVPAVVLDKDKLYAWGDYGAVTCLEAATGKQLWQAKVGGEYYTSPVLLGNRLYNLTKTGEVVVVDVAQDGKEVGRTALGEKTFATPAVVGDRMYLRTLTTVWCVGK